MITILKKFNYLFDKGQKKKIMILFFMMIIGAFLEVLGVSLMLPLVTAIMQPNIIEENAVVSQICALTDIRTHQGFVLLCIFALIAVFIIKDCFLIVQYYAQARFAFNNRFATQRRLLHTFMVRPYEYYLQAQTGEIMRIIGADVAQTYTLLTTMLSFATESIVAFALILTVFVVEPAMTILVALAMGVVMLAITKCVKPVLRKEGLSRQENSALTNKWLLQAITGIKEVKVTNKEEFFEENYNKCGRRVVQAERRQTVLNNIPRLLIEMVTVSVMLILMAIMIYMGREVESLIPSIGAFAMAAMKLLPSANRIVGAINTMVYQEPALNKTLENLKALESLQIIAHTKIDKTDSLVVNDNIVLESISYKYPNTEKYVLHEANMELPVGKSVGIVGASGAGKTTAVDILLGLLNPQEGQILADGVDVMQDYARWLSYIAYIPQTIFMLDDTIRANVAFGLKREEQSDEQVWHALEEAQLADFVRGLPEGLDTTIGERGVRLSGGQRQRIGIARALYTNPELLIFDEATSALDNETEAAIMESINRLHGKKTMVIIAHRLQTIAGCDMVYRVQDGKIERER